MKDFADIVYDPAKVQRAGLAEADRARLKWRTEKVRVDSHSIDCLTFDQLYESLHRRMSFYPEASRFE